MGSVHLLYVAKTSAAFNSRFVSVACILKGFVGSFCDATCQHDVEARDAPRHSMPRRPFWTRLYFPPGSNCWYETETSAKIKGIAWFSLKYFPADGDPPPSGRETYRVPAFVVAPYVRLARATGLLIGFQNPLLTHQWYEPLPLQERSLNRCYPHLTTPVFCSYSNFPRINMVTFILFVSNPREPQVAENPCLEVVPSRGWWSMRTRVGVRGATSYAARGEGRALRGVFSPVEHRPTRS